MSQSTNFIKDLVENHINSFANNFQDRHIKQCSDPRGTINKKINNVFIAELKPEVVYYMALVRSFDSSLGNMIEKLAIEIAKRSYTVNKYVEGILYQDQIKKIATLLEHYKSRTKYPPLEQHYTILRDRINSSTKLSKRHESDYYLKDISTGTHFLIELKIGGDLDTKKARSEKEALLEQFAILSNTLPSGEEIKIRFATAYNKDGEGNEWKQERVKQFFAEGELLIGKQFWNFITKMSNGYDIILESYKKNNYIINKALQQVKEKYF